MYKEVAILGDTVKVSQSTFFLDDKPIFQGRIVEVDSVGKLKVEYNLDKIGTNIYIGNGGFDWYEQTQVIDINRAFKILKIDENPDSSTGIMKTLIIMTRLSYIVSELEVGYHFIDTFNPAKKEWFVFSGISSKLKICENPEEYKSLWLSEYEKSYIHFDGQKIDTYIHTKSHRQELAKMQIRGRLKNL